MPHTLSQPFQLDPVVAYVARLGDAAAKAEAAEAFHSGIRYAAEQAVDAVPGTNVAAVVARVRMHFGLPPQSTGQIDLWSVALIRSYLESSINAEAHIRGLLRETARAAVADLSHARAPRSGLLTRLTRMFTSR